MNFVSIPKWCDCKLSAMTPSLPFWMFQFQNGAIARQSRCQRGLHLLSFNSKMVRLQVKSGKIKSIRKFCFNSKMVRLQVDNRGTVLATLTCFNSKMVRLQGQCSTHPIAPLVVSIPKWCDCKIGWGLFLSWHSQFQFQNGAIAS